MDYAKEKKVELKFIIEKQEEKMEVIVRISKEKKNRRFQNGYNPIRQK